VQRALGLLCDEGIRGRIRIRMGDTK